MARESVMNYCPVCATPLERRHVHGKERPACPSCGFIHFCDPKVAAITLIQRDCQVLLTRRTWNPAKGRWTLPGGFVDCGEDPRDAAVRECLEETGLEVVIDGLVDLYYGRAHVDGADIVIVYSGHLVGGEISPSDDVDAVAFFDPSSLPDLAFSSTESILSRWKKGLS
jgi:ADP-ribose pyrophosphatase YjhB (NUDIX family)